MISRIQALPWHRLIKFAITGGTAFAIDFSIYFVLTRFFHVPYLVSRTFSIGAAFTWNFLLNRNWTFRATEGLADLS
jgi:putative flippase GtrA